ncbi:hypothetical protein BU26DRAFT_420343 [Trematosphaeria pertusa]|uniref:DUF7707 domain-containing protein n=1 Tax=Trematosphaeria pertusa TaxID=390896 RepID=A0A6A6IUK1_9PLEO|nr:uncharacterized protein BU26DRAFT_420343 [Trematosphaeria pertusa]KAF2253280.1 hypothetical protein BU26DRAFT_420343 [Trematosphaeria pertusa]
MRSIFALSLLAFAGFSAAQDSEQNNYPYTIDPENVDQSLRDKWCDDQKAVCPLICLQQPGVTTMNTVSNDCDPDALTYSCVCDDGTAPNVTQYTLTLPYYICTEWVIECVNNCNGDNTCGYDCRQVANHPCGAQDPKKPNATASSTTMSATASQTAADSSIPVTGLLGATSTSEPGAAPAMLDLSAGYGMAVVFAGVFAGFALL